MPFQITSQCIQISDLLFNFYIQIVQTIFQDTNSDIALKCGFLKENILQAADWSNLSHQYSWNYCGSYLDCMNYNSSLNGLVMPLADAFSSEADLFE